MATTQMFLQGIYVAYWGRAADPSGFGYWMTQVPELGLAGVAEEFATSQEGQDSYAYFRKYKASLTITDQDRSDFVDEIYMNLFNRAPDAAGKEYWIDVLEQGLSSPGAFIANIMNAAMVADNDDWATASKKIEAADYFTSQLVEQNVEWSPELSDDFSGILATVDKDTTEAEMAEVFAAADNIIAIGGAVETDFTLTDGLDRLVGNQEDNTFYAPIVQASAGFGNVTNTFDSGDILNGVAGNNVLVADLTTVVSGLLTEGPAISATTEGIQQVFLRSQYNNADNRNDNNVPGVWTAANNATIDAEKMTGVREWWSQNSRADIVIEDIRSNPGITTIGMDNTDAGVGFFVFYDPASLTSLGADSSLTISLVDNTPGVNQLENFPVEGIVFELDGEQHQIVFGPVDTYAQLRTQLETALEEAGFENMTVNLNADNTVTIVDGDGGIFIPVGYTWENNVVPADGNLTWSMLSGAPIDEPITANIVLDMVGRTSEGGTMVVGSMSTRGGIEVFNVQVGQDSWLQQLSSTNNALEVVNVSHLAGADGYLYLGTGGENNPGLNRDAREETWTDNRLAFQDTTGNGVVNFNGAGLYDVQEFNAQGFASEIKMSATLSVNSISKFLDVDDVKAFEYTLGDGGNNLWLGVQNDLTREPDFELNITGGAQSDRINLWDLQQSVLGGADIGDMQQTNANFGKFGVSIDGGAGNNTLEIISDTGQRADGRDSYRNVTNIQNLIIAGQQNTAQDLVTGNIVNAENALDTLTIATGQAGDFPGWSTTIREMSLDVDFSISGKNQNLPAGVNGDADQFFNTIALEDLVAIPGGRTTLDVNLDNTARSTGVLTVANLVVDNPATDTMNLFSNGRLETSNIVQNLDAADIDNLNLRGTQDLAVHITDLADNAAFDIDARELEGDLNLVVNGALFEDNNDRIRADANNTNILGLYGLLDDIQPTISGFQTLQFGLQAGGDLAGLFGVGTIGARGIIDLQDTTGVNDYIIANINGPLTLNNLSSTVTLGDPTAGQGQTFDSTVGSALTLSAAAGSDTLDLSVATNAAGRGLILNAPLPLPADIDPLFTAATTVNIEGFQTINLDLARPADAVAGDASNLNMDIVLDAAARDFIITGGAVNENDNLFLATTELPTTLNTVDVTGYNGFFFAFLDKFTGTDIEFVLGAEDAVIDLKGIEDYTYHRLLDFDPDTAPVGGLVELGAASRGFLEITAVLNPFVPATVERTTYQFDANIADLDFDGIARTVQHDSLLFLSRLAASVRNNNDDLDAYLRFENFNDGVVYDSLQALADADAAFADTDAVIAALVFGAPGGANDVGFGIQIQASPDSRYANTLDDFLADGGAVIFQARNAAGTVVYDSDNVINPANTVATALAPVLDTYEFSDWGQYQPSFTFTEFDADANGGFGSVWAINNFVLGDVDPVDGIQNADTLTVLDISAFGITNINDLDFGFNVAGWADDQFGIEGQWRIDTGLGIDLTGVEEELGFNIVFA